MASFRYRRVLVRPPPQHISLPGQIRLSEGDQILDANQHGWRTSSTGRRRGDGCNGALELLSKRYGGDGPKSSVEVHWVAPVAGIRDSRIEGLALHGEEDVSSSGSVLKQLDRFLGFEEMVVVKAALAKIPPVETSLWRNPSFGVWSPT